MKLKLLPTAIIVLIACSGCHDDDSTSPRSAIQSNTPTSNVPAPLITGPIKGGLRDRPKGVTADDPEKFGYVAKEYFIEGTARSTNGEKAPYKTRMLVLKPIKSEEYRGSVVLEWLNVTSQQEAWPVWNTSHEHMIRDGYAYVAVSVQKAGVDGSPLSLKSLDPQRYGDLSHPGDEFSFDIWSQAGQALRLGEEIALSSLQPDPLEGLVPRLLISSGHSQSASRIVGYINNFHEQAQVFDGFLPLGYQLPEVRDDLSPILGVYGEWAAANAPPRADGENFLVWEVGGAAHGSYWNVTYGIAAGQRNRLGPGTGNHFDREDSGQYGEKGGGPCPQNFFPDRYAWNAAIFHLENWVLENVRPPSAQRIERDPVTEELVRDTAGNVTGGLRLPPLDVPVATYTGNQCELLGDTVSFSPLVLGEMYPTHEAYVLAMSEATNASLAAGYMLLPDAQDLMRRAHASDIGKVALSN